MEVIIRESIAGDANEIEEVRKIAWIDTYPNKKAGITVADIENKLKNNTAAREKRKSGEKKNNHGNKTKKTWVADENGKIIGFCAIENTKKKNKILAMYILPQYRGKGIGGKLITYGLEWLSGDKKTYVNVVEYNLTAINFYEKHGFVKTGKRGVFDSGAKFPNGKSMIEIELSK
ncbi:MAG: GNAT family N-acetyltransferase [Candidatus Paceibacterota bacterium]